jgi:exosortase/archaeosortase family protein
MTSRIINILKTERKQVILLLLLLLSGCLILFIGWGVLIRTEIYHFLNEFYNEFTAKIVINAGAIFDYRIIYESHSNLLMIDNVVSRLVMPVESYKYLFTGFLLLVLQNLKNWKSYLPVFIFIFLFIALRASLISYIMLVYKGNIHSTLLVWLDPAIFIALYVLVLQFIHNNYILRKFYLQLEKRFSEILNISFAKLILLLIIIPPLPRVIFAYLHSDILPAVVNFILSVSKFFLGLTGRNAVIDGQLLYLENNWVDLEYPCIGIGVFSLVAVLIFSIRDKFSFKLIYLSAFALIYMIMNGLRLAALLLYVHNTYHEIGLDKLLLHNYATYFMYIIAFAGFTVYWMIFIKRNV